MTSRAMASGNVSHINSRHTHPVIMSELNFSTPVYVHSGIGTISYEGNTYLGVGDHGGVSSVEETEDIVPAAITIELSGLNSAYISEALNSANYGDKVRLFYGYRNDDGSLVDDPWIFYRGRVENSRLIRGVQNVVQVTIQHALAVLNKATNAKYTDEEQQRRYPGDTAFSKVNDVVSRTLHWGSSVVTGSGGGGVRDGGSTRLF